MINLKYFALLGSFFFAIHCIAIGQTKIKFKDAEVKSEIDGFFKSYDSIDSLYFQCYGGSARSVRIYRKSDTLGENDFFDLKYDGDLFFIKKNYPLLYETIFKKNLIANFYQQEKNFSITLTPRYYIIQKVNGFLVAEAKQKKMREFTEYLNQNYPDSILPPADSVIIIQTIVNKDGSLGEKQLLYGKNDPFYDFVFEPDKHHSKYMIFQRFFNPYINAGSHRKSIADIFVRLNADNTFTVSVSGLGRKLKIKKYTDNPRDPLFY